MKRLADVAVVGGGVIGAAVAYYLSKGRFKVVLLEKGDIAAEATGASISTIGPLFMLKGPPEQDLCLLGWDLYRNLAQELDCDLERQAGIHIVITNEEKWKVAQQLIARQKESRQVLPLVKENRVVEIEPLALLGVDDVRRMEPFLNTDGVIGSLYAKQQSIINPFVVTQAFIAGAKRLGAEIITHAEVKKIDLEKSHVQSVHTGSDDIGVKFLVNAAGAWSSVVGEMVGFKVPVFPRKGEIVITEPTMRVPRAVVNDDAYLFPPSASQERKVVTKTLHLDETQNVHLAFCQTRNGNCILGVSSETIGYDKKSNPATVKRIAQGVFRYFPIAKQLNILRTCAGLRPLTDDGLPILGKVGQVEGYILATGAGVVGIREAPATGKLISEIISGAETSIPLEVFAYSRFGSEAAGETEVGAAPSNAGGEIPKAN